MAFAHTPFFGIAEHRKNFWRFWCDRPLSDGTELRERPKGDRIGMNRSGRLIVLYLGSDVTVLDLLQQLLEEPLAGG